MAAMNWLNQIFQGSEKMRGLSGGVGSAVALDDANSFYNFRLRRHYTDDEIVDEPHRLWFTNDDVEARTGLGPHIAEVLAEGQRFNDVLIVLADDNWDWCEDIEQLKDIVQQMVNDRFRAFLQEQGLQAPPRPLNLWMVRDRAEEIGGTDFGLVDGEFITGLLPNLYRKPGASSKPVVTLHLNLPGAWEGYKEVGCLYDDQPLLTVGNHWLDNVSHEGLREAALYRLQQDDEGGFFHIINPDLQGRYQLHTTDADGTSIITLASREGEAIAHLVLAVEEEEEQPAAEAVASAEAFEGETPDIAAPMIGDDFVIEQSGSSSPASLSQSRSGRGGRTILPEAQTDRIFTLQERGVLFQKVHFHKFMLGYDVFVGTRGEVGTFVQPVAATFQIRVDSVSLVANQDNVTVNGRYLAKDDSVLIDGDAIIEIGSQRLEYRDLSNVAADGWPYVGEIRRPASSTYMLWGQAYVVGRSRDCRVVLPDDKHQDNIVWRPGVVEGAMIKSKKGPIQKSQFYTDSIMVSAEHAAIDLAPDHPEIETRSRGAFSFVRRGDEVFPVYPAAKDGPSRRPLLPGDEILVGNCLFHVAFSAEDGGMSASAPAPAPKLSSDSLVDAVDDDEEGDEAVGLPDPGEDAGVPSAFAGLADDPAPPSARASEPAPAPAPSEPEVGAGPSPVVSGSPEPVSDLEPVAAAPTAATPGAGEVAVVDDQDAQFELGRPARLVQVGWAINGKVVVGNHSGADLVVPENRVESDQTFTATDYFQLKVRGRKASLSPLSGASECRIGGEPVSGDVDLADVMVSIIRRDEDGDEDFTIDLTVVDDPALPDPRARLVSFNTDEPLAVALVTRGFPLKTERRLALHGLELTGTFDGESLTLSDYLDGYRQGDGFRPFFHQRGGTEGGESFLTAPEDGSPLVLQPGDRIVVDGAVFRFERV